MAKSILKSFDRHLTPDTQGDPIEKMATLQEINDDWTKTGTWDLFVYLQGELVEVTTVRNLVLALGDSFSHLPDDRQRVQTFMDLPAAIPMPNRLRREVERFLASGDPFLV